MPTVCENNPEYCDGSYEDDWGGIVVRNALLAGTIPTEIGQSPAIGLRLLIEKNYLSGTLPTEIGQLHATQLFLEQLPGISGTIPTQVGRWRNIQFHIRALEKLSGTLPTEMGGLSLAGFTVERTRVSGTLPDGLTERSIMWHSSRWIVSGNRISGTVPWDTLGSHLGREKIRTFIMSHNAFSGTIASNVSQMTLPGEVFTLENNAFSGTLPTQLGDIRPSAWFNLKSNRISGTVPSELGKLGTSLRSGFGVSMNSLSGTLPTELVASLRVMDRTFEVGSNLFSGTLPSELGSLSRLQQYLVLSDNNFEYPDKPEARNIYQEAVSSCFHSSAFGQDATQLSCFGIPPNSCSAFRGAKQSWSDPSKCIICPVDMEPRAVLLFVLIASLLALMFALARFIRVSVCNALHSPHELRNWVGAIMILVTHAQTIALLSGLRIGWPRSLALTVDATINAFRFEQFACFFNEGTFDVRSMPVARNEFLPVTAYAREIDVSAFVMAVTLVAVMWGLLISVGVTHRAELVDTLEVTLSIVFTLQLSVSSSIWLTLGSAAHSATHNLAGFVFVYFAVITLPVTYLLLLPCNVYIAARMWRRVKRLKRFAHGIPEDAESPTLAAATKFDAHRLTRQVAFVTARFSSRTPRWQFVIWLRLLATWGLSVASQLLHPSLDSLQATESHVAGRYGVAVGAMVVTLAAWYSHHRAQPYVHRYQNVLESWLHSSTFAMLALACTSMALPSELSAPHVALEVLTMVVVVCSLVGGSIYVVLKQRAVDESSRPNLGELDATSSSGTRVSAEGVGARGSAKEVLGQTATRHEADNRLLHMVKGLIGSALTASQIATERLSQSRSMTASAWSSTRRLMSDASSALEEAVDSVVYRQIFSDMEQGIYTTRMVQCEVRSLLISGLRQDEGRVEISGEGLAGDSELWLKFDERMLRIVIAEALSNCRKYREPDTPILCTASYAKNTLRVAVENQNKHGVRRLTEAECEAVMRRGLLGHNATASSTGIGLDTAMKATTAANGRVWLSTRAESGDSGSGSASSYSEEGTGFTSLIIELPAGQCSPSEVSPNRPSDEGSTWSASAGGAVESDDPRSPSEEWEEAQDNLRGLRVALADDVKFNRTIAHLVLSPMLPECSIMEAASGEELMALVAQEATTYYPVGFDLFVVDEDMGDGLSGTQVISRLREMLSASANPTRKTVFVCFTAAADDLAERTRLLAAGADLVWSKPLPSRTVLLASLREALTLRSDLSSSAQRQQEQQEWV